MGCRCKDLATLSQRLSHPRLHKRPVRTRLRMNLRLPKQCKAALSEAMGVRIARLSEEPRTPPIFESSSRRGTRTG